MIKMQPKLGLSGLFAAAALILLFQNCGPAKLTSDSSSEGASLSDSSLIGTKVDLPALLRAAKEPAGNVLTPPSSITNDYDYAVGAPVIENLVLLKNDFTRIEWIHESTQTVVALGESFNKSAFAAQDLGTYHIIGYRDQTPFVISHINLINKTTASDGVATVGAVNIGRTVIESDSSTEKVLVTVDAPTVDLASIRMTLRPGGTTLPGTVVEGKRALLVPKKLDEAIDVDINLSDSTGRTLVKKVNLIAKELPNAIQQASGFSATITGSTIAITYTIKNAQSFGAEQWMFIHISEASNPLNTVISESFVPNIPTTQWNSNVQTIYRSIPLPATMANGDYSIRAGVFLPVSPWTRQKLNIGPGVVEDINFRYIIGGFKLAR